MPVDGGSSTLLMVPSSSWYQPPATSTTAPISGLSAEISCATPLATPPVAAAGAGGGGGVRTGSGVVSAESACECSMAASSTAPPSGDDCARAPAQREMTVTTIASFTSASLRRAP